MSNFKDVLFDSLDDDDDVNDEYYQVDDDCWRGIRLSRKINWYEILLLKIRRLFGCFVSSAKRVRLANISVLFLLFY